MNAPHRLRALAAMAVLVGGVITFVGPILVYTHQGGTAYHGFALGYVSGSDDSPAFFGALSSLGGLAIALMGFVVIRGEFRSGWSATRTRRLAIGAVIVALLCALIVRYDWDSARYIVYEYGIEGGRGTSSTWWIGSGLRVSTVGVVVALAASLLLMISTIRA